MYTPLSNNTADLRLDGRSVQHAKILEMVQNAPLYVSYPWSVNNLLNKMELELTKFKILR